MKLESVSLAAPNMHGGIKQTLSMGHERTPLVRLITQKGIQGKWLVEEFGVALLFCAARTGHVDVAKSLLEQGVDANTCSPEDIPCIRENSFLVDAEHDTPLRLAIRGHHFAVIDLLFQHGAELDPNGDGPAFLLRAIETDDLDLVKCLLRKGVPVEPQDSTMGHPLHRTIHRPRFINERIAKVLLEHGANPNATDSLGSSFLALVAATGDPGMIQLLLQHGAHADSVDCLGRTPLFEAVVARRLSAVKALLKTGNVNTRSPTCAGRTPVSVASNMHSTKILQLLTSWEAGAHVAGDEDDTDIDIKGDGADAGHTPDESRYCDTCHQSLPGAEPYLACRICKPMHRPFAVDSGLDMCLECVAGGLGCYDKLHTLEKKVRTNGVDITVERVVAWRQTTSPVCLSTERSKTS
ncbi:ankyrin repeat-containing domain protein [Aspergillus carlsbadensis]|nr:ankyrin repeat-containing domain protein [Aspergillus carlsbadensis]